MIPISIEKQKSTGKSIHSKKHCSPKGKTKAKNIRWWKKIPIR